MAVTVLYTYGFGLSMYLAMRVTGTIWTAIVLHGLTDSSGILSSGGVGTSLHSASGTSAAFGLSASLATVAMVLFAVFAVFLARGKVAQGEVAPGSAQRSTA